jgi:hypothetical protein
MGLVLTGPPMRAVGAVRDLQADLRGQGCHGHVDEGGGVDALHGCEG